MARPTLEKWVASFFEVFSISMGSFYSAINTNGLFYDGVVPIAELKLSQILPN